MCIYIAHHAVCAYNCNLLPRSPANKERIGQDSLVNYFDKAVITIGYSFTPESSGIIYAQYSEVRKKSTPRDRKQLLT